MDKPIIEVNNLGKKYLIGEHQPYLALRDSMAQFIRNPFHLFKKRTTLTEGENDFWALKDVNFKVNRGEVIGIIGRNGAGKSTLLKIISQITPPTTGSINLRGRAASLLEVGTGFHPELTGRENIMLNGALLGMKKQEIKQKFDQIVEFAEISKFLDTPVKRYSSGMYVRLAFSVAAHLEPEILIVDEVLAVGDTEFQKKCLGKMEDVTHQEGRTILFVSHNMGAVKTLCKRAILLEKGHIVMKGEVNHVIEKYASVFSKESTFSPNKNKEIFIKSISLSLENQENSTNIIPFSTPYQINLEIESQKKATEIILGIGISNDYGEFLISFHNIEINDPDENKKNILGNIISGVNRYLIKIDNNYLRPGRYILHCSVFSRKLVQNFDHNSINFEVDSKNKYTFFDDRQMGIFIPRNLQWQKIQ